MLKFILRKLTPKLPFPDQENIYLTRGYILRCYVHTSFLYGYLKFKVNILVLFCKPISYRTSFWPFYYFVYRHDIYFQYAITHDDFTIIYYQFIWMINYHIEAETKWMPFRRRHFQMHFPVFVNDKFCISIKISLFFP